MQLIVYIVRSFRNSPLDTGPNAFCQCIGLLEKCDYFVIHKSNHVQCSFSKRLCCRQEALEQMLHVRVNGRPYIPSKALFKTRKDYIRLPQINSQAANTARSQCGCLLSIWKCEVAISKPWVFFDRSFKCTFMYIFCCKESFITDVVIPTIKLHAAIKKTKS